MSTATTTAIQFTIIPAFGWWWYHMPDQEYRPNTYTWRVLP